MKGSHIFWFSRSKGMTADIWIRGYNPPRCFQKKISGRGKHNEVTTDFIQIDFMRSDEIKLWCNQLILITIKEDTSMVFKLIPGIF
jgi:hypothetical protein